MAKKKTAERLFSFQLGRLVPVDPPANPFAKMVDDLCEHSRRLCAEPHTGNSLAFAIGSVWDYYPRDVWLIDQAAKSAGPGADRSGPNRFNANREVDRLHGYAVDIIVANAKQLGIKTKPILLSASCCRRCFADGFPADMKPKGIALEWPNYLDAIPSRLSARERERAFQGNELVQQVRRDAKLTQRKDGSGIIDIGGIAQVKAVVLLDQPIDDEDRQILLALKNHTPLLRTGYDIEAETGITRKTVGERLNALITKGLACKPNGPKKGAAITQNGIALLAKCAAPKMAP